MMNSEAKDMLEYVITPVNNALCLGGLSADKIMVCTGETESGFDRLRQENPGEAKAISPFQVQRNHFATAEKYLNRYESKELKERLLAICLLDHFPPYETMAWNLRFAAAIARLKYKFVTVPLPAHDDLDGMAHYWLKHYNGDGEGKGTVERFKKVCAQFF